jgi:hypothetical protein
MALSQIILVKDPDAVKKWTLNYSTNYLQGTTLSASTWTVPSGITQDSESNTTTTVTFTMSGGTEGTNYRLVNHITDSDGGENDVVILIRVVSQYCHTIAGQDIEHEIRFDIDDSDPEEYEYSSSQLNLYIKKAVETYGKYRSFTRKSTLTTVADQDLYELPADCTRLISCQYRTAEANEYDELDNYYPWLFEDWDYYALTAIRNHLIAAYDEVGMGMWREVNYPSSYMGGRYVILYPPPEQSGDSIEIWYGTNHPLSGMDYDTIPSTDKGYIRDIAVALVDMREARLQMHGVVDYDAGQTRSRSRPRELQAAAKAEIRRIERILSSTAVSRQKRTHP